MRTTAAVPALGAVLALTVAGLGQIPVAARPAAQRAVASLGADPASGVRVTRGPDGAARTLAVSGETHHPAVDRATDPGTAARAHLTRYGGLLGLADRGTTLVGGTVSRSVTGDDVVRFRERRDGLPVIGGAVAVDLRPDRQLGSVTATVSRASVPSATYPSGAATDQALAVAAKLLPRGGGVELTADPPAHRLWDPAVLGVRRTSDPTTYARGVWWVEVHAGQTFHRALLIDDRTGAVVQDLDLVEQVDRVVCDDANAPDTTDVPCKSNFARTEGGPRSSVKDVNDAYDLAGAVSTFYRQIGGINLTKLLGVDEGDHLSLSSTVRFCDFLDQVNCPLRNAFWNGLAMFYGQGYASADDVVGHEMTHGVISHNSDLFYWGQSGAINESLADIMGEIVDHRHHTRGESRHSWSLGEDLPGGAIRNMKHPATFHQPDSMTSRRYVRGKFDNGGVHTNSGVGNRTFYLISQGGKQGGRSVHGIDGKSLKRSATLYLDVIQHLVPGSDYADLAAVLDRSCRDLARHHTVGMTSTDCRNVHRATLATRMRTVPPRAKQPPDAALACPKGAGPVRVLFDSEKGTPSGRFDPEFTWLRAPNPSVFPAVPANATSGHRSWFSSEPPLDAVVSSLVMHPVALPAGRPAYLWFQQWRLIESVRRFDGTIDNNDGGTVEVADKTLGRRPKPAERLPWVNGPRDVITGEFGNPAGGRVSFSGDSRGYLASRLRLTRYAGNAVSPQFTMNTDLSGTEIGWYLDDIRVYTCGRGPVPRTAPSIQGTPTHGSTLTADPGRWSPSGVQRMRWYADGKRIPGATGTSYTVRTRDVGKRISVRVTATAHHRDTSTFSPATPLIS